MWSSPADLEALSDIFAQASAAEAAPREVGSRGLGTEAFPSESQKATPATIGPKYEPRKKSAIEAAIEAADQDSRVQPEYEFIYKQAVTPNDVYLQMSDKNPSTIFCEELVMKIKLPDTEACTDLKLDVKPTFIKLASPLYYLAMYLPHKVNETKSSAKWDSLTSTLSITMPIVDRNWLE